MMQSAKYIAMHLLARREHSQKELARKLTRHDFSQEEIQSTLAELSENGYQSDARFAEAYARARTEKGFGSVRIRQALIEKGVAEALIDDVLMHYDWGLLALKVLKKRFGNQPVSDFKAQAKRMRFLQYRGFINEHIQQAMETVS